MSTRCAADALEQTVDNARSRLDAQAVSKGLRIDWRDDRVAVETDYGLDCPIAYSLLVTASRGAKRHKRRVTARSVLEGINSGEELISDQHGTDWEAVEALLEGTLRGPRRTSGPSHRSQAQWG